MGTINLYDPRELNTLLEERLPPRNFFGKFLFTDEERHTSEHIDIDRLRGARRVARFVDSKMPATHVEREGYRTETITPPLIKESMNLSAAELQKRQPGQDIYGAGDPNSRLAYHIAKDYQTLDEMIQRREELMRRDILFTGKVAIAGDGINAYDIDLGQTNTQNTQATAAARWDKDTANIIGNIRAAKRKVAKASGANIDSLVVGADVADVFDSNTKLLALLDNRRSEAGILQWKEDRVEGVTYIGNLAGVDIYAYDEWYIDPVTKNEEPMVPPKKILYFDSTARAVMHYGMIIDLDIGSFAQPRVGKSWTVQDPSSRYFMVQSRPLPFLPIGSVLVDTVLA